MYERAKNMPVTFNYPCSSSVFHLTVPVLSLILQMSIIYAWKLHVNILQQGKETSLQTYTHLYVMALCIRTIQQAHTMDDQQLDK